MGDRIMGSPFAADVLARATELSFVKPLVPAEYA
jgi:hypothetical protein